MADDVARVGRAEIGEDLAFERRWRLAQRIAWVALTAFVLGGLVGVFGRGPLSAAQAVSDTGLARIDYQRFARYESSAELKVSIDPRAAARGAVSVLVAGALRGSLRVERTAPRPLWMSASPLGEWFVFAAAGEGMHTVIRFSEEPRQSGFLASRIELGNGGGQVAITQFVYP